jgi:hypothetical protein
VVVGTEISGAERAKLGARGISQPASTVTASQPASQPAKRQEGRASWRRTGISGISFDRTQGGGVWHFFSRVTRPPCIR